MRCLLSKSSLDRYLYLHRVAFQSAEVNHVLEFFSSDEFAAVNWLLASACLCLFSLAVTRWLRSEERRCENILNAMTLGFTTLIVWAFALSCFKLLTGWTWMLAVSSTSIGGLWCLRSRSNPRVATNGVSRHFVRRKLTELRMWHYVWGILIAVFTVHVAFNGLLTIPSDFDCLMYHLPLLDEWLQARCLYSPESSYNWTPGNSELIGLWMVAPFSGDFLQALNNVPVVILWGVATWGVCRQLGLPCEWCHLATLAVFATYTTLHETDDASNDLAVAAFATAAMHYALAVLRRDRLLDVVGCGLQLGLLVGVKYFGIGYAGLIGGGLIALTVQRRGAARGFGVAICLGATSFVTGGYWYVRNAWLTGSPVAPMGITQTTPDVGYPESLWRTTFLANGSPEIYELGVTALWNMTGPCHFAAVIALPFTIFWLLHSSATIQSAFSRKLFCSRMSFSNSRRLALACWLGGFAIVYLATPFCVEDQPGTLNHLRWAYTPARYGLSFLSIAMVAFVVVLHDISVCRSQLFGRSLRVGFALALISQWAALVRHGWNEFSFAYVLLLGANLGFAGVIATQIAAMFQHGTPLGHQSTRLHRLFTIGGMLAISCLISAGVGAAAKRWHSEFANSYELRFRTPFFEDILHEESSRIKILVLDQRIYPFFGSRRQFAVCRPRYLADGLALKSYCRAHQVTHLATRYGRNKDFDLYRNIPKWVNGDPDHWKPLYPPEVSYYSIFQFHDL